MVHVTRRMAHAQMVVLKVSKDRLAQNALKVDTEMNVKISVQIRAQTGNVRNNLVIA